jgi:hypothetical protein
MPKDFSEKSLTDPHRYKRKQCQQRVEKRVPGLEKVHEIATTEGERGSFRPL